MLCHRVIPVIIEIFTATSCQRCVHAKAVLREQLTALVEEFGADAIQWREMDVVEALDHAVALGVIMTPSIVINNKLVFAGLPSARKLRTAIIACLPVKNHESVD